MLIGIERLNIQTDNFAVRIFEKPPRARGKVRQPRSNSQNHIRFGSIGICRCSAGNAQSAERHRRILPHRRLSGLSLAHWDAVPLGKRLQLCFSLRVKYAAARNNKWLFGPLQCRNRVGQFVQIRSLPAWTINLFVEKTYGIIKGFRLNILTKCQSDRSALGRICQNTHGAA